MTTSTGWEPRIETSAIPRVARGGDLPLAFAQERVWLMLQLAPGSRSYQTQAAITFRGALDVAALEWALGEVVRRHEIFRTTFHDAEDGPVQRIHPPWPVRLPVDDLSALQPEEREEACRRRVSQAFETVIDPTRLPLVRWSLLKLADDHHVLAHAEHHLIHDGWSFNVVLRDALELYRARLEGRAPALAELPVHFADFCAWQRAWMRTDEARAHAGFWRTRLAGAPQVLELPTDRPRPPVQRFRGDRVTFAIDEEVERPLRSLARGAGATLFQAMLAAFAVLLSRWSGQDAVTVGTGVAGRGRAGLEGVAGMFVNVTVLVESEVLLTVKAVAVVSPSRFDVPFHVPATSAAVRAGGGGGGGGGAGAAVSAAGCSFLAQATTRRARRSTLRI